MDVIARTAPSSLRCFMDEYSGNNSGPMHMLYLFLKHVAHNVDYVFWSESSNASGGGAMVLSSCILECEKVLYVFQRVYLSIVFTKYLFLFLMKRSV